MSAPAAELARAQPIIERSALTYANLAYRGDKRLIFSESGEALLMYAEMGRSRIAMGDPLGPLPQARALAARFRDECRRSHRWCVFFEVRPERLAWYLELGLQPTPLGEEARVAPASFDLDAPHFTGLRQKCARLRKAGCRFELEPAGAARGMLPELEHLSRAWLAAKRTREKGFSNASFDAAYLERFPLALVRRGGELLAFANVWQGAGREEVSVDLMRRLPGGPNGTMDLLFCELLQWAKAERYRWFNLGMAPLSGLETASPLWRRLGTFIYLHAEHFYNFRGLRAYKEKFRPVWTPLYLASPGGAALPGVLLDVTALIAGGYRGIFAR